ncbi:cobaltochelatase subunit CobN [Comamonas sp. GB3 AK4-5]|uniref:cobaltochelatase subunit CobN n=1 Tax=Comamonas sp. GB3 AK4-5 TaxID=3231487 RepID=UPI00351E839D
MTVLFISASNVPLGKFHALEKIAAPHGIAVRQQSLQGLADNVDAASLPAADLVVIDAYQQEQVQAKLGQAMADMERAHRPYLWHLEKGPQGSGMPQALVQRLAAYYLNGGQANYAHYFQTLQQWHAGSSGPAIADPVVYPKVGIYHPKAQGQVFLGTQQYLGWRQLQPGNLPPVVAINFHQQQLSGMQTEVIDDLIARIEQTGAVALPYFNPSADEEAHHALLTLQGQRVADVLINTRIMLNSEGSRRAYEALGIPVIQATTYRRGSAADWEADPQGIPAMDLPLYVAQPEFTGISDIQIASAVDGPSGSALPLEAQAQSVVNKALRLVALQRKPNAQKRISLFFWNSPPGEKNLASAFMNVPASMVNALQAMQAAGYATEVPPQEVLIPQLQSLLTHIYRNTRLQDLVEQGQADTLPVAQYEAWLAQLPASVRLGVDARWGAPAQSDMVITHQGRAVFVIPRLVLGHVALLPQPPRSDKRDDQEKALYHSLSSVPTHFYLATYLWAREAQGGWGSDAIIHFGTHGSQEWLPGKERGLRVTDYASLMVGDLPVVYPYIVDNIGEAQQAKRRGRALTLSYQTPPFQPAGMHQDWTALHDLLHAWQEQDTGAVKDQYRTDILAKAQALRMDKDMGWKPPHTPENFAQFVDSLHAHLHELAETIQPLGLHSLGQAPADEHRIATVAMMLGKPYWYAAARAAGVEEGEIDEAMVGPYETMQQSIPLQLLQHALQGSGQVAGHAAASMAAYAADPALRPWLEQGRDWYARLGAQNELPALLHALSGQYIPTSYGGDPVKNPDAFPTGRNLYGFDPARVPSPQAWQAGKQAAEQMLEVHRQATGKPLSKVTFSLWSVETMRHQGILEAQALHLMGVEPVWDKGGRVVDVKLQSRQALGRPRVDVVLSATGLYRDHFPNTLKLLAKAAKLVATTQEADNPAWAFSQQLRQRLLSQGVAEDVADDASQTRIFSTASGEYGTGLPEATLATDSWGSKEEGNAKLAQLYLNRMQTAYGPDEKRWGMQGVEGAAPGTNLYAEQLKGTQAAVLARSSNTYGMLTTDDPFQYLGGIGLAVRALNGEAPALYISNLRNPGATRTEAAQDFLAKELATRQFHPGYIQGLMKEGYSGTLRVLDATNNLWGWTAVAHEIVRDDQWQEMADVYVNDKHQLGVQQWMEERNPHAYAQTMERMLEAARKGYWQADAATLSQLKARYSALQQRFDVHSANQAFMDYVQQGSEVAALPTPKAMPQPSAPAAPQAQAAPAASPPDRPEQPDDAPPDNAPPTTQVSGMVLEKTEPTPDPKPADAVLQALEQLFLAGLLLAMAALGAWAQTRPVAQARRKA